MPWVRPRFSAAAMNIAQIMAAGPLMVMDVVTCSMGMSSKRTSMSARDETATPPLSELADGHGVVVVIAHEGGHVEGSAEARLTLAKEELESSVSLLSGPEAGKHAHCPEPSPVSGGMYAAQERVLAGHTHVFVEVGVGVGGGGMYGLDGRAGDGGEEGVALSGRLVLFGPVGLNFLEGIFLRRFGHSRLLGREVKG